MLAVVNAEALQRIAATRSVLRLINTHERTVGAGDDASRSLKGLIFVHNYAVYEYVVIESVRGLVANVNSRALLFSSTRVELLAMALNSEFTSVIAGSIKKTWAGRMDVLKKSRSQDALSITEGLFPKDGSHFRPPQLETIWSLFGVPGAIVPNARLRTHITEMVETRNRIAHGNEAPATVGSGFTVTELEKRVDDTEAVCTHIIASISRHAGSATAFS